MLNFRELIDRLFDSRNIFILDDKRIKKTAEYFIFAYAWVVSYTCPQNIQFKSTKQMISFVTLFILKQRCSASVYEVITINYQK